MPFSLQGQLTCRAHKYRVLPSLISLPSTGIPQPTSGQHHTRYTTQHNPHWKDSSSPPARRPRLPRSLFPVSSTVPSCSFPNLLTITEIESGAGFSKLAVKCQCKLELSIPPSNFLFFRALIHALYLTHALPKYLYLFCFCFFYFSPHHLSSNLRLIHN